MRQGIHRLNDRHAVLLPYVQQSGVQGPHPERDGREDESQNDPDQNQEDRGNSDAGCTDRIGSGGIGRLFTAHSIQISHNGNDQVANLGQRLTRIRRSEVDSVCRSLQNLSHKRKSTTFQNAIP